MEKAKGIMTNKIVTISIGATLYEAYDIMKTKNIRHLPVMDKDHEIIGILSDRDIQRAMQVTSENFFEHTFKFNEDHRVEHFMSWPVVSAHDTDNLDDVIKKILKNKISAVLVKNAAGSTRGILTVEDLLKYMLELLGNDPSSGKKALRLIFTQYQDAI